MTAAATATLHGPKKTPAGYFLALQPAVAAPTTRWSAGQWAAPTEEWTAWATAERDRRLAELVAHPTWFSRPPRIELLSPLFGPWAGTNMAGQRLFMTDTPPVPGDPRSGTAVWMLEGLLMSSTAIRPVWAMGEVTPDADAEDQISIFGDGETVDEEDEDAGRPGATDEETREIQLEEIAMSSPAEGTGPMRIRNREWEARKFMAKERVREARLKAQIAERIAATEERRFYAQFGELDDGESHFSDYDLTEEEVSESGSGSEDEGSPSRGHA